MFSFTLKAWHIYTYKSEVILRYVNSIRLEIEHENSTRQSIDIPFSLQLFFLNINTLQSNVCIFIKKIRNSFKLNYFVVELYLISSNDSANKLVNKQL